MKLLCFPVLRSQIQRPFASSYHYTTSDYKKVDWSQVNGSGALDLTNMLNQQVINEVVKWVTIIDECSKFNTTIKLRKEYTFVDNDVKKRVCDEYLPKKRMENRGDVFARDNNVLNRFDDRKFGLRDDRQIYAVVLLSDTDRYFGHIYTWVGPENVCFALGIRTRVDSAILKIYGKYPGDISKYLIDGVVQFAQMMSSTRIVITNPLPVMEKILPRYGFITLPGRRYRESDIGGVLSSDCGNILGIIGCYERKVSGRLTDAPFKFIK